MSQSAVRAAADLSDFLGGDLDGVLLLTAVVQRGPVHVFVMEARQLLHLLTDTGQLILNLHAHTHTNTLYDIVYYTCCPFWWKLLNVSH